MPKHRPYPRPVCSLGAHLALVMTLGITLASVPIQRMTSIGAHTRLHAKILNLSHVPFAGDRARQVCCCPVQGGPDAACGGEVQGGGEGTTRGRYPAESGLMAWQYVYPAPADAFLSGVSLHSYEWPGAQQAATSETLFLAATFLTLWHLVHAHGWLREVGTCSC
jgi:hypothetical protein